MSKFDTPRAKQTEHQHRAQTYCEKCENYRAFRVFAYRVEGHDLPSLRISRGDYIPVQGGAHIFPLAARALSPGARISVESFMVFCSECCVAEDGTKRTPNAEDLFHPAGHLYGLAMVRPPNTDGFVPSEYPATRILEALGLMDFGSTRELLKDLPDKPERKSSLTAGLDRKASNSKLLAQARPLANHIDKLANGPNYPTPVEKKAERELTTAGC